MEEMGKNTPTTLASQERNSNPLKKACLHCKRENKTGLGLKICKIPQYQEVINKDMRFSQKTQYIVVLSFAIHNTKWYFTHHKINSRGFFVPFSSEEHSK